VSRRRRPRLSRQKSQTGARAREPRIRPGSVAAGGKAVALSRSKQAEQLASTSAGTHRASSSIAAQQGACGLDASSKQ